VLKGVQTLDLVCHIIERLSKTMLIGYMRVSRSDGSQTVDLQRDATLYRHVSSEGARRDESMSAYAGTYAAGEKVVHHVDTSWNGSWTGTDQVRFYKLDGETLTITTAPLTVFSGEEVKVVLEWKKVHEETYNDRPSNLRPAAEHRVILLGVGKARTRERN
jgi:hypothetical protein